MGFRETYGGIVEEKLNEFVDKNLNAEGIKEEIKEQLDKLVDKHLADLKHKLKAEVIDLIDGVDDIQ